jgi:hypothetical protein
MNERERFREAMNFSAGVESPEGKFRILGETDIN